MTTNDLTKTIDRLVDGELPDTELRELLRNCDEHPSQWQAMALAFVESHVLSKELSSMRDPESVDADRRKHRWHPGRWLSGNWVSSGVAALIAIGIGFGVGQFLGPERSGNGFDDRVVDLKPTLPESPVEKPADSFRVWVSDNDGSLREVVVPVHDDIDDFRARSPIPVGLVEQLRRQGHPIEHRRRFVPVTLQDGRDAIVPIDDMRVLPRQFQ